MGGLELAILAAAVVAILLFVVYLVDSRRERGLDPYYAQEVFLYKPTGGPVLDAAAAGLDAAAAGLDAAAAGRAAATLGSLVATEGQVVVYAAGGGWAPGCGRVAGGRALRTLAPRSGVTGDGCDLAASGAWLYGPKPRRLYPGVAPFNGASWFQTPA